MSEDHEQSACRSAQVGGIALIGMSATLIGHWLIVEFDAHELGAIAWEFAHGLPKWRRKFRQGWREQAAERES